MDRTERIYLESFFATKASVKRFRKTLLQVADEQEQEIKRLKDAFGTRTPAELGEDFLAKGLMFLKSGTAVRRRMRREMKRQRAA